MLAERRHIITAMGLSNALGDSVDAVWTALLEGRPRTSPPPFELPFETVCGAVQGPLDALPAADREFDSRLARIVMRALPQVSAAVARARQRWGADRVAILVGTSTGGLDATELAHRHFRKTSTYAAGFNLRTAHAFDALNVLLARVLQLTGPSYAVSTACTSSVKAIASATRLLEANLCDAALVVGADALCETTVRGFHSLGVLSKQAARPFSSERDGIHIGEGAALLLVERHGEGPAYVASVGETSDAHSMSAPHPEGKGAAEAIQAALAKARLSPQQVDYVNAHGTGTEQNDQAESRAILSTLGSAVPVSSTKGLTGHTLGACGATEAAFCTLAIQHGFLPPSAGATPLDPGLGIHVVRAPARHKVKVVLSNAFAFGGSNTGLILAAT
ncbi:MAG: beta-ketoacyl-ACP synthase [Myxococcales bacterium]